MDAYFENYERELSERSRRGGSAKVRLTKRLAAAKAEHARHRADQVGRHEIAVVPHVDTLLVVAEPAWRATLQVGRVHHAPAEIAARFVPRVRWWDAENPGA